MTKLNYGTGCIDFIQNPRSKDGNSSVATVLKFLLSTLQGSEALSDLEPIPRLSADSYTKTLQRIDNIQNSE